MESGLEVIIPHRARISPAQIEKFILEKQEWILKNMQKIEEINRKAHASRGSVPFLGKDVQIELRESNRKTAKAFPGEGFLEVRIPFGKKKLAGKAIESFYKKQAHSLIPRLAREKAKEMGVSFSRISIRAQKTRWGSCSARSTLSFNWRLLAAPQPVLEYIVVHELAHLRHRNHSKRYWAFVKEHFPGYKEQERWLRRNKHLLKARTNFQ